MSIIGNKSVFGAWPDGFSKSWLPCGTGNQDAAPQPSRNSCFSRMATYTTDIR